MFGTGAAVVFKGSGFYQTDYRSDSYKKAASADSDSGASKSSDKDTSSTKSESTTPKTGGADSAKPKGKNKSSDS